MSRAIVGFGMMFGLILLVLVVATPMLAVSIPDRTAHIAERDHIDALELLPAYYDGVCAGKWVGYNIVRGQIMVKCRVPDTTPPACLFVFYRVTENRGTRLLTSDDAYNPTCLVEECWKYNKGYQDWDDSTAWGWDDAGTWIVAPLDLKAAIISAFGAP